MDKLRARKLIAEKDVFLILAVIFLLLFWKLPRAIGSGGWINERLHLFVIPLLLPWLSTRFHRIVKQSLVGCWILLSLVHLGYTCRDMSVYNREMSEFARIVELPDHTVFKRLDPDYWGTLTKYALPYFNGFVSYGFSGDRAYIHNYEAEFDYFPINFKGNNNRDTYDGDPITYRIGWNIAEDSQKLNPFHQDYDLSLSDGSLIILRHKLFDPARERVWDLETKKTGMMQFVMGDLQTSQPGTYPLVPELRYRPGGMVGIRFHRDIHSMAVSKIPKMPLLSSIYPMANIRSVLSFNRIWSTLIELPFMAMGSGWGSLLSSR